MRLAAGGRTIQILKDIDLEITRGEFIAVMGPSGSGKSTLLGLIAGLDRPTEGRIELDGIDLSRLSEDDLARLRRRMIGFVFQSYHLIPTLTAIENVLIPLEIARQEKPTERAGELLAAVSLADRADHYPAQLSGGEQQRVAIARAFACRPAILLADEPTGNLDTATGRRIIDLLVRLHREEGNTMLLVTHDSELASRAGRIISLIDGEIR